MSIWTTLATAASPAQGPDRKPWLASRSRAYQRKAAGKARSRRGIVSLPETSAIGSSVSISCRRYSYASWDSHELETATQYTTCTRGTDLASNLICHCLKPCTAFPINLGGGRLLGGVSSLLGMIWRTALFLLIVVIFATLIRGRGDLREVRARRRCPVICRARAGEAPRGSGADVTSTLLVRYFQARALVVQSIYLMLIFIGSMATSLLETGKDVASSFRRTSTRRASADNGASYSRSARLAML